MLNNNNNNNNNNNKSNNNNNNNNNNVKNSFQRNSVTDGTLCHAIGHFVFYYHHVTYRMPCHASGHLVIYCECYRFERAFVNLRYFFYLTLFPTSFKAFLRAGSSTLRLAGFHVDLRNIAPAQLLF